MLLWVSILALFGGLVRRSQQLPLSLRAHVLAVQAWVASAFLSVYPDHLNPFLRIANRNRGRTSIRCCRTSVWRCIRRCSISAMSDSRFRFRSPSQPDRSRIDAAWARWVRTWTLVAWISSRLGIAMGSYWAYYESAGRLVVLGYGRERSLMPWLRYRAVAFRRRDGEAQRAQGLTILLSILTFSLSLLGTFLVRSGVLTSVHAFATIRRAAYSSC